MARELLEIAEEIGHEDFAAHFLQSNVGLLGHCVEFIVYFFCYQVIRTHLIHDYEVEIRCLVLDRIEPLAAFFLRTNSETGYTFLSPWDFVTGKI